MRTILPGWSPGHTPKAGERFGLIFIRRRRWWQIWKPRAWRERRCFIASMRFSILARLNEEWEAACGDSPPLSLSDLADLTPVFDV